MDLPPNLGKWLIENRPSKDELYELEDLRFGDEGAMNNALLDAINNWDDLIEGQTPETANWFIWQVFGDPFFLQHEKLTEEQTARLVSGCERITLSIPRIHPPNEPMGNGFFMLWDLFEWDEQPAYDALRRLIDHPDYRVQYAALHGLGHRGDARIPTIHKYIKKHPYALEDDFVKQCLDGTVM